MPNRLSAEQSPYLRQHQHNPVEWFAWGPEAFEVAERQGKPIFLSIGYSTCYWCHVMEQDSFESPEVAEALNRDFISIKVDREERPDLDQIYMQAVLSLTGHGGWPMSVFLTPQKEPFWGGTFFPHAQFLKILEAISSAWREDRSKVERATQEVRTVLAHALSAEDGAEGYSHQGEELHPELVRDCLRRVEEVYFSRFDSRLGGFGDAPKFPPATQIRLLLRLSQRLADPSRRERAQQMASFTLERMARGGLFDQLGGGFHRYSTDAAWIVPHFEKMLYDNALLARAYLEAYQRTGKSMLADVARLTCDYVIECLESPGGGFFAAEDAGEVGKEGEFYVWGHQEIWEALGTRADEYCQAFGVSSSGNFEHAKNVLTFPGLDWEKRQRFSADARILSELRSKRTRPHRDEKILVGWNGLMIAALADAARILGSDRYLEAARRAARRFLEAHEKKGSLFRGLYDAPDGEGLVSRHQACLEDYAYLIEGLLTLYQADFDEAWLSAALRLQDEQEAELLSSASGTYFTSAAKDVIFRSREVFDGATPSPNAVALSNLFVLSQLLHRPQDDRRYGELRRALFSSAALHPEAAARALMVYEAEERGVASVAVVSRETSVALGNMRNANNFVSWANARLLPHLLVTWQQASELKEPGTRRLTLLPKRALSGKQGDELWICRSSGKSASVCEPPVPDSPVVREKLAEVPLL